MRRPKYTALHCYNILCLQNGDGYGDYCRQNDVIVIPSIHIALYLRNSEDAADVMFCRMQWEEKPKKIMEFVIAAASPASTTIGRKRRRLVVRTATRAQFTALICTRRPPIYFVRFRRTRSHRAVYCILAYVRLATCDVCSKYYQHIRQHWVPLTTVWPQKS